jgi:hypothetical protein
MIATFAILVYVNANDDTVRYRPVETGSNDYYEDHGDGAAMIVGVTFASFLWPATLSVFIYYRFFNKD